LTVQRVGLLDTSVFIARETGRPLGELPEHVAISVVTIGELRLGVLGALDDAVRARRAATLALARSADPIPISEAVIVSWSGLVADCKALGIHRAIKLTDALIAATAIEHGLPIVTQDADYDQIARAPGLACHHGLDRDVAPEPAERPSTLLAMSALPSGVQRDYPLSRLTTIRTGGPAELFARAGGLDELERLVAWAAAKGIEVGVVGSGSNLLIADAGVRGLVVKLDKELNAIELDGTRIRSGGGARLPAVSARAAQAGLTGIEFGVNIPGTVGGAVRMNANAYGGELARVLEWVEIVSAGGTERRTPETLDFVYRRSNLQPGEIVARASFALREAASDEVKATLADMRKRRKEAQPSGIKTFGSTFKNPDDPRAEQRTAGQLLDAAGCRGLRIGGASFSAKHANFVENHGDATTADVISLMAEGRRRVKERFGIELEPEVQSLGPVEFPSDWGAR
jgi:UDP-N-acetylmuramate dehydrogenase